MRYLTWKLEFVSNILSMVVNPQMYVHKLTQTILKQKTTTNHFKNFKNCLRNYWKNCSNHSYQTGSKKSMIGNEFVFNNNVGLHYKCHDISLNLKFCWFDKMHKRHNKPKKRQLIFQYQTINSFRYFITVILNYKKIVEREHQKLRWLVWLIQNWPLLTNFFIVW